MTIIGWLIQNYPVITTLIASIFGGFSTYAFNVLRKRKEEVTVTGTEHDTVKRISQSSIETIERLNTSFEALAQKLILQREEFGKKFEELNIQLVLLSKQNGELRNKLEEAETRIDALIAKLTEANFDKIDVEKSLKDVSTELKKINGGNN